MSLLNLDALERGITSGARQVFTDEEMRELISEARAARRYRQVLGDAPINGQRGPVWDAWWHERVWPVIREDT